MSQIKEEADKVIDVVYKLNPGFMLELLVSPMVQDGIAKGIELVQKILDEHDLLSSFDKAILKTEIERLKK